MTAECRLGDLSPVCGAILPKDCYAAGMRLRCCDTCNVFAQQLFVGNGNYLKVISVPNNNIFEMVLESTCIATDNACKLVINLIFNTIIYRIYIQYGYL